MERGIARIESFSNEFVGLVRVTTDDALVTVFALHLAGAIENAGPFVELSIEGPEYYAWQDGLFSPALVVRDGTVAIPDGPGWGVEISPSWLARADRLVTEAPE